MIKYENKLRKLISSKVVKKESANKFIKATTKLTNKDEIISEKNNSIREIGEIK